MKECPLDLTKNISQTGGNTIAVQEYSQQEKENRDEQYRLQGEYGQARDFAQLENDQTGDDVELQLGHEDRLRGPGSSLGAQDRMEVECNQPPGGQAPNVEVPLSDQDCEDVCKTIGEIDVGKLRLALQSAVYISPILLLSDAKIYRWNWNQLDILKVRSIAFPFDARNTNLNLYLVREGFRKQHSGNHSSHK